MTAKWYIIHTISGAERRVKQLILEQAAKRQMSDCFKEIIIPVVEVPEVKRGKKVLTEKKFMPGYVFIKMDMFNESWHLVKDIPKISGFLGSKSAPKVISEEEMNKIFAQLESENKNVSAAKTYEIGEKVTVLDGPFDGFIGIIDEINLEKQRMKLSILIFGNPTPMDLSFSQVTKKLQ